MARSSAFEFPFSPREQVAPALIIPDKWAGEEAEMAGKDKSKTTDEKQKHDEKDDELERELEDSFPASDPPSLTQPSETGAPDHKGDKAKSSGG